MKITLTLLVAALCSGCASTTSPFIQDGIRIVPPVTQEGHDKKTGEYTIHIYADGGTRRFKITDAEGAKFNVYVDHRRTGSSTPGAIYLVDYPGKSNSVLVVDQQDFRRKIKLLGMKP